MKTTTGEIVTKIVSDNDGQNTFEVMRELKGVDGEKAIVVQLFPTLSEEDVEKLDITTFHLINKMRELGLSQVRVINLFSQVCKSERLSTRNLPIDTENIKYIENIMQEDDFKEYKFVVAWGSSMSSCHSANECKQLLVDMFFKYNPKGKIYKLYCEGIPTDATEPPHVLFMGIRHKNSVWRLVECNNYKKGGKKNVSKNKE